MYNMSVYVCVCVCVLCSVIYGLYSLYLRRNRQSSNRYLMTLPAYAVLIA